MGDSSSFHFRASLAFSMDCFTRLSNLNHTDLVHLLELFFFIFWFQSDGFSPFLKFRPCYILIWYIFFNLYQYLIILSYEKNFIYKYLSSYINFFIIFKLFQCSFSYSLSIFEYTLLNLLRA